MYEDDRSLAKRLLGGDSAAFRDFFNHYFPRIYRFALRRLGNDTESARDVAQAVLTRGMRKLALYRGEASLFTWLCQIARHEIADLYARGRRFGMPCSELVAREDDPEVRAELESLAAADATEPEQAQGRDDLAGLVHAALDYLPQRYAQVLELKYLEDMSVERVAERLGVTPTAVQSLLARARVAFREACTSLGHDLELSRGGSEP